jgi:hypothetical protein
MSMIRKRGNGPSERIMLPAKAADSMILRKIDLR